MKIRFTPPATTTYDDLQRSLHTSAEAMHLSKFLVRLTVENIAHADQFATKPGGDAYRAKLPVLGESLDPLTGALKVFVQKVVDDSTPQESEHNPDHPGADKNGMVKKSNVNHLIEKIHLSKYQKSANANLQAYQIALKMRRREIEELLRG